MDDFDAWARDRVSCFLSDETGAAHEKIDLDKPLSAYEGDSLNFVEFVMDLEDELQIEIPNPPSLITVGDLVAFVRLAKSRAEEGS